jgi:hypothetical protein
LHPISKRTTIKLFLFQVSVFQIRTLLLDLKVCKSVITSILSMIITFIKLGFDSLISTQDVSFGPYNIVMCRPGQIASAPLNESIGKKGLIVAFDFYPYQSTQMTQTIFSIRDTETNVISLRLDYFESNGSLDVWINPVSSTTSITPYYVFSSSAVSVPSVTASKSIIPPIITKFIVIR